MNYLKIKQTVLMVFATAIALTIMSCDNEVDLPEAGSLEDVTPPEANFTAVQGEGEDFATYSFPNLSTSATTYLWDFGDGNTSTELDGQNTYPGEGTFTVTLTASDNLGAVDTTSQTIVIEEPEIPDAIIPTILEASFEDNSLPDGSGDGRESWRNSSLGGVIQINTSSSVPDGGQAAKLPSDGSRIGYQELEVTPNTDYSISYTYRMEGAGGNCTVAILAGGGFTDTAAANAAELTSFTGTDESYTPVSLLFNSGANTTISIFFYNTNVEARIDKFIPSLQ